MRKITPRMCGKCFLFFDVCHVSSQKPVVLQTILPCLFEPEFDPVTINVFDQPWKPVVLKTFFSLF